VRLELGWAECDVSQPHVSPWLPPPRFSRHSYLTQLTLLHLISLNLISSPSGHPALGNSVSPHHGSPATIEEEDEEEAPPPPIATRPEKTKSIYTKPIEEVEPKMTLTPINESTGAGPCFVGYLWTLGLGPTVPYHALPRGQPSLKQPYSRFMRGRPQGGLPAVLQTSWIP
jgi:hypothetical protein